MAIAKRLRPDTVVSRLLEAGRGRVLTATLLTTAAVAVADRHVGSLSLGGLYLIPMLLAATVLSPRAIILFAVVCAALKCAFDDSHLWLEYGIRFFGSLFSYVISGLFVVEVIRNREMTLRHLSQITHEQRLRNVAQERLKTFVESSPAAILTLNREGTVIAANHAAHVLFGLGAGQTLEGRSIKPYMPVLTDALRLGSGREELRTAAQAQGRKEDGTIFLSDAWFSTYGTSEGTQLAAIVVDSSEEMRDREELQVQQLSTNSRLVAAAVLHEIRNFCGAISVVYSNLKERQAPCRVEEIQGLETLVKGLGRVASLELYGKGQNPVEEVPLQQVLDDLRIVIEPNWQEVDGCVCWNVPEPNVRVLADRYGLMQVFMNLAQNSHRAVQASAVRKLAISVASNGKRVLVTFRDTGCGIANPGHLFQPFQQGADVTGLGLFISRVILRNYGGELRYDPVEQGCSFVVDLPYAGMVKANA